MQVNVAGVRRNLKNIAHNYTDAQVKVREATSNDPWGPSCRLMSEIADLTYNVMAFSDIMTMIWKRLNDHGKNWRHVYKALTLLEHLIKTGSDKVIQQCKENIFAIQTLKDFQYYEDMKDHGVNVREKAKLLVTLLKDDEKLQNERARALEAKKRFAQSGTGFGSDGAVETFSLSLPTSPSREFGGSNWSGSEERTARQEAVNKELENARPQTIGEEELQLQLALAMSREEAEQEEQRRKSDDVRLQLALSQSQNELGAASPTGQSSSGGSHMLDLLDLVPTGAAAAPPAVPGVDPWGMPRRPQAVDPWLPTSVPAGAPPVDPWAPVQPPPPQRPPVPAAAPLINDPWAPVTGATSRSTPGVGRSTPVGAADPWSPSTDHSTPLSPPDLDDFAIISNRPRNNINDASDAFDLSGLADGLNDKPQHMKKSPQSFLGENSGLVNLENLVTVTKPSQPDSLSYSNTDIWAPSKTATLTTSYRPVRAPEPSTADLLNYTGFGGPSNPFGGTPAPAPVQNLFQQSIPPRPSLNQMSQGPARVAAYGEDPLAAPLSPSANPFLS